jgi:hypothetical protein
MKSKKIFFALICIISLSSSCEQEDELNLISENMKAIELQDSQLEQEPSQFKCPLAVATLSPCGYGFNVTITFAGSPIAGSYPYTIKDMGGTLIDSGSISNGMNTTWVLGGCQAYEFEFWGSWCSSSSVVQIATSDGCGGVFVC